MEINVLSKESRVVQFVENNLCNIVNSGLYKDQCLFLKLPAKIGAYHHGVTLSKPHTVLVYVCLFVWLVAATYHKF